MVERAQTEVIDVTVETTSTAVTIGENKVIVGLVTPASADSTAMTFTVSDTFGGTYVPLAAIDGVAVSATITTTATRLHLSPTTFAGVRYIKLVAGSTETPAKTYQLVVRDIS